MLLSRRLRFQCLRCCLTRRLGCAGQVSRYLAPVADEALKHHAGNNNDGGECGRVNPTWPKERRLRSNSVARDLAEHRAPDSGIELRAEFRWGASLSQQPVALREFFGESATRLTTRQVRSYNAVRFTHQIARDIERNHPGHAFTFQRSHCDAPFFRDSLSQYVLIFARAELTCERTVTGREPRACATSSVEKPSRSRSTNAARSFGGSDCSARRTSASCCSCSARLSGSVPGCAV